jgi:CheY-like chemotaxis protein
MSKGKRLLVVDDEPDLREILADEFRSGDVEVLEAANGVEALAIYKAQKPDAVISDIRMPGGDGLTLAKNIKELDPTSSRVFLITGFADLTVADAYQLGVEGFFSKPFRLDEVKDAVLRSLYSDEEKWKLPVKQNVSGELSLKTFDWKKDFFDGVFPLGRGGFFLPMNLMSSQEKPVKIGDLVAIKTVKDEILGTCAVRWLRSDGKDAEPGVGLEFLSLEPQFLNFIMKLTRARNQGTYIPSNVTP